jgi:hypothetical protein
MAETTKTILVAGHQYTERKRVPIAEQFGPWPFREPRGTAIKTIMMASQTYLAVRAAAPEGFKQASISPCFSLGGPRTAYALDYAISQARQRWGNAAALEIVSADAVPFQSGDKLYPAGTAVLQNATAIMTLTFAQEPRGGAPGRATPDRAPAEFSVAAIADKEEIES